MGQRLNNGSTRSWSGCWWIIAVLMVCTTGVQAQERVVPRHWAQLWLDAQVKKKLADRLKGTGMAGYRTGDEQGRGRQFLLEAELEYKLIKQVSAGFEQRASFRSNEPDRHRTGLTLMADERFGRTSLDYRLALQHTWRERGALRDMVRNRFKVEYDIKGFRFDPEVSVEFFTALNGDRPGYDAVRWKAGTTWKPRKGHALTCALSHDREQNRKRPDYRWIFSFGYVLDLDKLK